MYIFDKMEGSFSSMLLNIANGIVFGFSVNEIVFNLIEDESNPLFNGMVGIKNVKSKDIKTLFFDMDEFGTIKGLIQRVAGSETKVPLEKVILYTYDPYSTGFPQGVSDLAAAFRHYVSKEALMRYRNLAAEKFSAPTVIGKYPRNFTKAQQDELLAVCSRVAINGAGIIPDVASIELLESNTSVIMPYDTAIDSCNRGIARSIFGQILATDEGKDSGSFAQAKIHKGILGMYLDGLRFDIAEAVKEQVVRRLVKYNYNSSLVPNVELAPADRESIDIIANVMSAMISSGVVGKDEPFVREALGFPAKPEELMGDATIDSSSIPTVVAPIDGTQTQPVDDSNTQVEPDKGVTDAKDTKVSKTV
jgi:phage gp29-like protein